VSMEDEELQQRDFQQLSFDFHTAQPQIVADRTEDTLNLKIGEFAGPLDLLLYLIKQEEANIFDIPVAKITDAYLKYLRLMDKLDITIAGDFLVMAATLIEIKSRMLLPRDPFLDGEEEEDDPRKELVDRLLEHQKFQQAAQMLWSRAGLEQATFTRGRIESDDVNDEVNVSVFDLITVFQKILARQKEEIQMEIEREEKTLTEMLDELNQMLNEMKELNMNKFFSGQRTRSELVLAFMAVLEIVKTQTVALTQSQVFGDIILRRI
jgi:segregation and condensation protein A